MGSGQVVLHARLEHGGFPVRVETKDGSPVFTVEWPTNMGGAASYLSRRQMIRALYNHGNTSTDVRDPGMSFSRYFRVGPHAPVEDDTAGPTIYDLFMDEADKPVEAPLHDPIYVAATPPRAPSKPRRRTRRVQHIALTTLTMFGAAALATATPAPVQAVAPLTIEEPVVTTPEAEALTVDLTSEPLGIDLEHRSNEVRKLLFAGFGQRMFRSGYEPEEVLQEVYKGLLARNRGRCPFDPTKSSFGHYVYMVCNCILSNYHRKQARRFSHEQTGLYSSTSDVDIEYGKMVDASQVAVDDKAEGQMDEDIGGMKAVNSLRNHIMRDPEANPVDKRIAIEAVPYVYAGHGRSEIARKIGIEPSKVGKALALIRKVSIPWAAEQGLALA